MSALATTGQLVLVVADDWTSTTARLQRFERHTPTADWAARGEPMPVTLGKSGLAWGRSPFFTVDTPKRVKMEGDGCAPAGIFALTAVFGEAAPDSAEAQALRLPYLSAHRDLKGIDDPASCHYNQIVDQRAVSQPDWQSHEEMLRDDTRYRIGVVVAHNEAPALPGAGSCIFMHVWAGPEVPTAGCTAAALADMSTLCAWLDGAASPLLVQLPQAEYQRLHSIWGLPPLP